MWLPENNRLCMVFNDRQILGRQSPADKPADAASKLRKKHDDFGFSESRRFSHVARTFSPRKNQSSYFAEFSANWVVVIPFNAGKKIRAIFLPKKCDF